MYIFSFPSQPATHIFTLPAWILASELCPLGNWSKSKVGVDKIRRGKDPVAKLNSSWMAMVGTGDLGDLPQDSEVYKKMIKDLIK